MTPYEQALAHLVSMSKDPAWKAHAWLRAQELDKVEIFEGIKSHLVEVMQSHASGSSTHGATVGMSTSNGNAEASGVVDLEQRREKLMTIGRGK